MDNYNELIGKIAQSEQECYIVRGWYLDSNGSLKTYSLGYSESFIDVTEYQSIR